VPLFYKRLDCSLRIENIPFSLIEILSRFLLLGSFARLKYKFSLLQAHSFYALQRIKKAKEVDFGGLMKLNLVFEFKSDFSLLRLL
jgi:hypothetical protein